MPSFLSSGDLLEAIRKTLADLPSATHVRGEDLAAALSARARDPHLPERIVLPGLVVHGSFMLSHITLPFIIEFIDVKADDLRSIVFEDCILAGLCVRGANADTRFRIERCLVAGDVEISTRSPEQRPYNLDLDSSKSEFRGSISIRRWFTAALALRECLVRGAVNVTDTLGLRINLSTVDIADCVTLSDCKGSDAVGAATVGMRDCILHSMVIVAACECTSVRLDACMLERGLRMFGSIIGGRNEGSEAAFAMRGCTIRGDVSLDLYRECGPLCFDGTDLLDGSLRIRGRFRHLIAPANATSLSARDLRVSGNVDFGSGRAAETLSIVSEASDPTVRFGGLVDFSRAMIGGNLDCEDVYFDANAVPGSAESIAWLGHGLRVLGQVCFKAATIRGRLDLSEARIEGGLDLDSIDIAAPCPTEPALKAEGLIVSGWVQLRGLKDERDARIIGTVSFRSAALGEVELRLASFDAAPDDHETSDISGIAIEGNSGIKRRTSSALSFAGAHVTGSISFDEVSTRGSLDLAGLSAQGAIVLHRLNIEPAVKNDLPFKAISLLGARARRLVLDDGFYDRIGESPRALRDEPERWFLKGWLDLSAMSVDTLADHPSTSTSARQSWFRSWAPLSFSRRAMNEFRDHDARAGVILDGFVYRALESPSNSRDPKPLFEQRLRWLELQPKEHRAECFRPQPWKLLAQTLADGGHADEAVALIVCRKHLERCSRKTTWLDGTTQWFLESVARYGYRPWRTVFFMVLAWLLFAAIWYGAAAMLCQQDGCIDETVFVRSHIADFSLGDQEPFHGFLPQACTGPEDCPTTEQSEKRPAREVYPPFNPLRFSLEAIVPFMSSSQRTYWFPHPETGWGIALVILYYFEALVGFLLISVAIVGFTGLLRDDEPRRR